MLLVTQALLDMPGKQAFNVVRGQQVQRSRSPKMSPSWDISCPGKMLHSIFMDMLAVWDARTVLLKPYILHALASCFKIQNFLKHVSMCVSSCSFSNVGGLITVVAVKCHTYCYLDKWRGDSFILWGFSGHAEQEFCLFTYSEIWQWASSVIVFFYVWCLGLCYITPKMWYKE